MTRLVDFFSCPPSLQLATAFLYILRYHLFISLTLRLRPRLELSVITSTVDFEGASIKKSIYFGALLTVSEEHSRMVSLSLPKVTAMSYADLDLCFLSSSYIKAMPPKSLFLCPSRCVIH